MIAAMRTTHAALVRGTLFCAGPLGYGVFSRREDGTLVQHVSPRETPYFRSPRCLASWVNRNVIDHREGGCRCKIRN